MKTLINCYQSGPNNLTHQYLEDGIAVSENVRFKPFLGVHALKEEKTSWTDIYGTPTKVIVFDSMTEMRNWKKENSSFLDILGDIPPETQFVATQYRNEIPFQTKGLVVWNIDLECCSDNENDKGFPVPSLAKFPITAITIQDMMENKYWTLGCGDYTPTLDNVEYIKCDNETDLLKKYIRLFNEQAPHILTGWNILAFDVPYIVNRVNRVLGPEYVKKLSIDKVVKSHDKTDDRGRKFSTYSLQGTIVWDYIELYKKYIGQPREGFSLNYIAQHDLGMEKVSYAEEHDKNTLTPKKIKLLEMKKKIQDKLANLS